jgi:hypothetical protein
MAAFKAHGFDQAAVIGQIYSQASHALRVTQEGVA